MIDAGGRIKETSVESMARTLHSLTFTDAEFDPTLGGPRISILFTNFSRYEGRSDSCGIPGINPVNRYDPDDIFEKLIEKFKNELA